MRFSAKVSTESPHRIYIPKEVASCGFTGDVDIITNGKAIVIVKPETTLDELEASLALIINSEKLVKSGTIPINHAGIKACDED